jgi:hypothetical protein
VFRSYTPSRSSVRRVTTPATYHALQRVARPLRARAAAGWAALALGTGALLLGVAAWVVRLGRLEAPYWVLLAWAGALGVLAVAVWLAWRSRGRLSAGGLAGRLEEVGAWRHGALTALLERSASGTSGALLDLADRLHAEDGMGVAGSGRAVARPRRSASPPQLACSPGPAGRL